MPSMQIFYCLWALFLCASARPPLFRRNNINGYTGCTNPKQKEAIDQAYKDAIRMTNLVSPFLLDRYTDLDHVPIELKRGVLEKRFFGDDNDDTFDKNRRPLIRGE
jgi:hypothetical protein